MKALRNVNGVQVWKNSERQTILKLSKHYDVIYDEYNTMKDARRASSQICRITSDFAKYGEYYGFELQYHPYSLFGYVCRNSSSLSPLLISIARIIRNLHKASIYHRDIKHENVVVSSDGVPILIDFDSASRKPTSSDQVGTIVQGSVKSYSHEYLDVKCYACLLYELVYQCRISFPISYAETDRTRRYDDIVRDVFAGKLTDMRSVLNRLQ